MCIEKHIREHNKSIDVKNKFAINASSFFGYIENTENF